jgi:hypothetical protein
VRLLHAKIVRPFVSGNKTDATDARAIWLAVQQPGVKFVGRRFAHCFCQRLRRVCCVCPRHPPGASPLRGIGPAQIHCSCSQITAGAPRLRCISTTQPNATRVRDQKRSGDNF